MLYICDVKINFTIMRYLKVLFLLLTGALYVYSQAPSATFSYSYVGGDSCGADGTNPTIQFSFVSHSNVDSFFVDFGDGQTQGFGSSAVGNPFSHTYTGYGYMIVSIKLYNSSMDSSTVFIGIRIYGKVSNSNFITAPDSVCVGEKYQVQGIPLSSSDIVKWTWKFSNGFTEDNVGISSTTFSAPSSPLDTVYLIVYGVCDTDTVSRTVEVKNSVIDNFYMYGNDSICPGQKFYLSPVVTQYNRRYNYTFVIDWGDGTIDTTAYASSINHTYYTPGTYKYITKLITPCGTFKDTDSVYVGSHWGASNTFNPYLIGQSPNDTDTICIYDPLEVSYMYSSSLKQLIISWGDGDTSLITSTTAPYVYNLFHKYTSTGYYKVIGTFENFCGHIVYDTLNVFVVDTAGYPILPNLSANPLSICPNMNVSFSFDANKNYTYKLIFGDGHDTTITNKSDYIEISHQYTMAGTYTPKLVVYSACNDTDTVSANAINVDPANSPGTAFIWATANISCTNAPVEFSLGGTPIVYGNYTGIKWNMGDGTTYTDTIAVQHSYSNPGIYVVSAEVTTNCGTKVVATKVIEIKNTISYRNISWHPPAISCIGANTYISLSINPPLSLTDTLIIDFGDGNKDTIIGDNYTQYTYANPGQYTIAYLLKPVCGNTATDTTSILILDNPKAEINASDTKVCVGETVTFTANPLNNYPSPQYSWSITYSNISVVDTGQTISYTFNVPGTYMIRLTGTGNCYNSSLLDVVYVTVRDTVKPTASFTATVSRDTVHLTNNSTDADYYFWDFGDGDTQWGNVPYHVYTANGTYTITLVAFNCDSTKGKTDTTTQTVTITTVNVSTPSISAAKVYPNPANDVITIVAPYQNFNVSIRTVIGTEVLSYTNAQGKITLPIKELPAGIYFIEIYNDRERIVKKMIKE